MNADQIYQWLEEVKDPEIPTISLIDLGVIRDVTVENESVRIEMTPTFVGCPALDLMKEEVRSVLESKGLKNIQIVISFKDPWTSTRISEKGKQALKQFGLAPPVHNLIEDIYVLGQVACPRCSGNDTELKSVFGATPCRSIHFCHTCLESFEQFKPL